MGLLNFFKEATPEQESQEAHDYNMRYSQPYFDQQQAAIQQQQANQWYRDNQDIMMGVRASAPRLSDQMHEQLGEEDPNQPFAQELKTVPAQEATGFYAGDPSREFLEQRNQAMIASGIAPIVTEGSANSRSVMDSVNSQINTIAGKRWDKENIAKKADTTIEQLQQYRARLPEGDPRIPAVEDAIRKASMSSPLVQVGLGGDPMEGMIDKPADLLKYRNADNEYPPHPMSYKELRDGGYALRPSVTEGDKKAVQQLSMMENATGEIYDILKDYDPDSFTEAFSSITGIDNPALNYARNQTERVVGSAKKTWAEQVLRDATGAVINPSEYNDYDVMFFPQPGEGKEEWEIKAIRRWVRESSKRSLLGKDAIAYQSPYGYTYDDPMNPSGDKAKAKKERKSIDYNSMTDEQLDAEMARRKGR